MTGDLAGGGVAPAREHVGGVAHYTWLLKMNDVPP
jgi:hypothetical protein